MTVLAVLEVEYACSLAKWVLGCGIGALMGQARDGTSLGSPGAFEDGEDDEGEGGARLRIFCITTPIDRSSGRRCRTSFPDAIVEEEVGHIQYGGDYVGPIRYGLIGYIAEETEIPTTERVRPGHSNPPGYKNI